MLEEIVKDVNSWRVEDEDGEDLFCGHSVEEHKEALGSVVEKMELKVN